MKTAFKGFICFALLISLSCSKKREQNSVVAQFDSYKFSAKDFSKKLYRKSMHLNSLEILQQEETIKDQIIYEFIRNSAIKKWAYENGLFINKKDLDKKILELIRGYKKKESFFKTLSRKGLSFKDWREELQNSLLEQKVKEKVMKKFPPITKKEIKNWYKQNKKTFNKKSYYKINYILVDSKKIAWRILELISSEESFNSLVKKYSQNKEKSVSWVEKTENKESLFYPIFKLKKNQVSKIIKGPSGYYIFKVLEISKKKPFLPVSEKSIRQDLDARRKTEFFNQWLGSQVKKSSILINKKLIQYIKLEYKLDQ